jgi:hypothetical protein
MGPVPEPEGVRDTDSVSETDTVPESEGVRETDVVLEEDGLPLRLAVVLNEDEPLTEAMPVLVLVAVAGVDPPTEAVAGVAVEDSDAVFDAEGVDDRDALPDEVLDIDGAAVAVVLLLAVAVVEAVSLLVALYDVLELKLVDPDAVLVVLVEAAVVPVLPTVTVANNVELGKPETLAVPLEELEAVPEVDDVARLEPSRLNVTVTVAVLEGVAVASVDDDARGEETLPEAELKAELEGEPALVAVRVPLAVLLAVRIKLLVPLRVTVVVALPLMLEDVDGETVLDGVDDREADADRDGVVVCEAVDEVDKVTELVDERDAVSVAEAVDVEDAVADVDCVAD